MNRNVRLLLAICVVGGAVVFLAKYDQPSDVVVRLIANDSSDAVGIMDELFELESPTRSDSRTVVETTNSLRESVKPPINTVISDAPT